MWRLTSVNELAPRHHGADTSSNKRMKIVFLLLIIEQMCTCRYSGVGSNQPTHTMSSLASSFGHITSDLNRRASCAPGPIGYTVGGA